MKRRTKTNISISILVLLLVLAKDANSQMFQPKTQQTKDPNSGSVDLLAQARLLSERAARFNTGPQRRELSVSNGARATADFKIARRKQTVVIANTFMATEANLKGNIKLYQSPTNDFSNYTSGMSLSFSNLRIGNTDGYVVLELAETSSVNRNYLFVEFTDMNAVVRSSGKIYQYYESSASSMLTFSLAISIVYMVLSCCCWFFGAKQFYHLIRIAQMLYMLALISASTKSAMLYLYVEDFKYNIFNIVPNPVQIKEVEGVKCQPAIEFFAEGLSCHSYNSLQNYVLGIIIFGAILIFTVTSRFSESAFFVGVRKASSFNIFMLTILPDVFIAVYLNGVAGLTNGILSLGFLFCIILILWEAYIISKIISFARVRNEEAVEFMRFFMFSRSNLNLNDRKFGLKVLAVLFEQLKALIIVTMIALFNTEPKTQMVIIFVTYILNAIFIVSFRPYTGIWQNFFFALSDTCFFIIVLLMLIAHNGYSTFVASTLEDGIGTGQAVLFWIIFLSNLFVFVTPVLKGQDSIDIHNESVRLFYSSRGLLEGRVMLIFELSKTKNPVIRGLQEEA